MSRIVVAIVLLISLVGPSWAGFDEGVAAYLRGDYTTALREFRPGIDTLTAVVTKI